DDALLNAAQLCREKKDMRGAQRRLKKIVDNYSQGDLYEEAKFLLAWVARDERQYRKALVGFEQLLEQGAPEREEGGIGRAEYWRARTLRDLRRDADAVEAYTAVIREHPLTYYGNLSIIRLREIAPERADEFENTCASGRPSEPLRFAADPLTEKPSFAA